MGTNSKIEWTNHTLNFWKGCTKVSDGCDNCYMYRQAKQYGWDPTIVTRCGKNIFRQPIIKDRKTGCYKWRPGDRVFVCSWSDFFHKDADGYRGSALTIMSARPDLVWVVVTKRIERAAKVLSWSSFNKKAFPNFIIMTTCENQEMADLRIPVALQLKSTFSWIKVAVSAEPCLGEIDLKHIQNHAAAYKPETWGNKTTLVTPCINGIASLDWVIIGCESGPNRRPCRIECVQSIVEECKRAEVPVFVKQLNINGKVVKDINQFPEDLRIREYLKGSEK